ncbi:MAG: hypothetical protein UU09_C0006G0011 [Microgenomates group bacterium GW2011_GWA2_40_6]|nr:MAG: hypothetical protein UU09_C0006G0011 [Microgenomates group bacterium GW2011_GWA2_40_6]
MKRIILSLALIAVAGTGIIGATRAYFSDTETSTGNSFAAGTLDLNLDGVNTNVVKFSLTNLVPGDLGTGTWILYNAGSINGYVDIHSIARTDNDNLCNEPEGLVDTTCGAGEGELSANMNVDLFIDVDHDGVFDAEDTTIYTGLLSGIAVNYDQNIALNALATKYISLNWGIPSGAGNNIQSDSVSVDMTFELGQTTAQ